MNKLPPPAQDQQPMRPGPLLAIWLSSTILGIALLIGDFSGMHQTWLVNPWVHGLTLSTATYTLLLRIRMRRMRIELLRRRAESWSDEPPVRSIS